MSQKILFVCSLNTCRSAMAEYILRGLDGNRFDVLSAGIQASEGWPMETGARETLDRRLPGCMAFSHSSQRVTEALMHWADVVVGISQSHAGVLRYTYPWYAQKITCFPHDVQMPGGDDYDGLYDLLKAEIEALFMK